MTVKAIVTTFLLLNGYDGLYHDDDCGCSVEDLFPCFSDCLDCCEPGYRRETPGEESDWVIQKEKP
jgi:hypothetical protein